MSHFTHTQRGKDEPFTPREISVNTDEFTLEIIDRENGLQSLSLSWTLSESFMISLYFDKEAKEEFFRSSGVFTERELMAYINELKVIFCKSFEAGVPLQKGDRASLEFISFDVGTRHFNAYSDDAVVLQYELTLLPDTDD